MLVVFGGLSAAVDAALSTVSMARVEELVRDERPGSVRLSKVMAERPRCHQSHSCCAACEVTATVLLAAYLDGHLGVSWGWSSPPRSWSWSASWWRRRPAADTGFTERIFHRAGGRAPLQAISILLTPISRLLVLIGNAAFTPGRGFRNGPFASEIELREVVDLAQQRASWPTRSAG